MNGHKGSYKEVVYYELNDTDCPLPSAHCPLPSADCRLPISPDSITFASTASLMEVTDEMVKNLADLSRLIFNDQEKEEIKKDLQRMISFVQKLNEVDTSNVEPLLHMTEAADVYREDIIQGSMQKSAALANAPLANDNYFKVPKVIKNPSSTPHTKE